MTQLSNELTLSIEGLEVTLKPEFVKTLMDIFLENKHTVANFVDAYRIDRVVTVRQVLSELVETNGGIIRGTESIDMLVNICVVMEIDYTSYVSSTNESDLTFAFPETIPVEDGVIGAYDDLVWYVSSHTDMFNLYNNTTTKILAESLLLGTLILLKNASLERLVGCGFVLSTVESDFYNKLINIKEFMVDITDFSNSQLNYSLIA